MRYLWSIPICILFIVSLTACQTSSSTPLVPESVELQTVTPMNSPTALDAAAQKMVTLSKENLAQRLGISVEQIGLVEVKPVQWRDAGLGCPKPGIDYIQVETPGYLIELEADGKTFNYHTDTVNRVLQCNR